MLCFFQVVILGVPVQLLGQQVGWAHFRAGTTANTGLFRWRFRQLFRAGSNNAVGGFDYRHSRVVQGEAHHWPTHDQTANLQASQVAIGQ